MFRAAWAANADYVVAETSAGKVRGVTVDGVKVLRVMDRTFFAHEGGKIEIRNKLPVRDRNDLSKVYTPGVARVCMDIVEHPEHVYRYTIKRNTVAIITDGTAVLGLGDIGPDAAMPVAQPATVCGPASSLTVWSACPIWVPYGLLSAFWPIRFSRLSPPIMILT